MGPFELTKLVSLYKAYCKGHLTASVITEEIFDVRSQIDSIYYKTGNKSEDLEKYITELEYLLFEIMQNDTKTS
jgi:hypothetical protein